MRKRLFSIFIIILCLGKFSAQKDSIYILAKLLEDKKSFSIEQEIIFHNSTKDSISEIRLLNWVAAYKNRNTPLYKRKIEERNKELHFAKKHELGGLENLQIMIDDCKTENVFDLKSENLNVPICHKLAPNNNIKIHLKYVLKLPSDQFTGYGRGINSVFLKYFFLVPDGFSNSYNYEKFYKDTEETSYHSAHWVIQLDLNSKYKIYSNLNEEYPNYLTGILNEDPEILITESEFPKIKTKIEQQEVIIQFGYFLNQETLEYLEFYAPLHLKFIYDRTGFLPKKIFISEKFKNKEDFFGNDPIVLWKFRFTLFKASENIDLDFFSILSKKVVEQSFVSYKEENHWLKNGIKTYLEQAYLRKNYGKHLLIGQLNEITFLGIKPLKMFHISELPLMDRYGIGYQYMMTDNWDQKINEPFSELSKLNEIMISNFETGSLFSYISDKIGENKFINFLKFYFKNNQNTIIYSQDFVNSLVYHFGEEYSFLKNIIKEKHRINFKLKSFKRENNQFLVKVKKNTEEKIPFKIETINKNGIINTHWFNTTNSTQIENYYIPDQNVKKIIINGEHLFPEKNYRDNYLYTKGLFTNAKKPKIKFYQDIPNPEYNEIYLNPRIKFNAYDKFLFGLNFRNQSFYNTQFSYSITPYYSSGTKKLTGSGGITYSFLPSKGVFRSLSMGVAGSYFHYDFDLAFQKIIGFTTINLSKKPRSAIDQRIGISYENYKRDISPAMMLRNEYESYQLWNINYGFSDNKLIHEKSFGIYLQGMEDFKKISAQAFYRYEYAPNKKIAFRLFSGYFLRNNTRNHIFDFGISRVSNYSFSYGLIGQSATSGILAQQFVLADGGFKSLIGTTANQWINTLNTDAHVWKMFNLYADIGLYKNKNIHSQFIWGSGIKLKIIPDFIEIFLPVYSSLGFEPGFNDYKNRIRFTLNLNLDAVLNMARRGWY